MPVDDRDRDDETEMTVGANEIVVFGSSKKGEVDVPQKAIETFEEEDIASYGAASIEELLEAISPQTTSGRGRGGGRPVILLSGQRISSFRELRRIPPEAIKRMQVLPEEVALRFGYPPNQRVVNIILKDHFTAKTLAGEFNMPTRGGYTNYELEGGVFNIDGPRRSNLSAKITDTSMLTEAERDITRNPSEIRAVGTDPDPQRFRSLTAADREIELNGTMTQGLGENGIDGSVTVNGAYTRSDTRGLQGLDSVTLSDGTGSAYRTLSDPLRTRTGTDAFSAGLGYATSFSGWQLNVTGDGSYTDATTRVDRRRDLSALADAAAAGELAIDGPLPEVAGAGYETARNRTLSLSSLATLTGTPFRLPGGDASLTAKAGYSYDRTRSEDSRTTLGAVTLDRGDVAGGLNLALPLTSKRYGVLGAIGDTSLNLSASIDHLSDFGNLFDWSAGFTWSPTDTLSFQASYIVDQEAPSLSQLGAPTVLSNNVTIYDFVRGQSVLVTTTTGGNPALLKEKRRDIKLSATWQLPFLERGNLMVEYFRNRSSDVTQSFPLLTPAIEAAFPDRVTRDAAGQLIALDRRPVTFDEVNSSSIRWGFNISGKLGSSSASDTERGGSRTGSAPRAALAQTPPSPVVGAAGPLPAPTTARGDGAGRMRDPARFQAMRQQLCGEGATGALDPAALPERLRERLAGADGKIDPSKLAEFKQRVCSGDGTPPPGGYDPERFARLRTLLCVPGTPDVAALPERLAARLKAADGSLDPQKLAATRERVCSAQTPPLAAAAPEPRPQQSDAAAPAGPPMRGFGRGGRGSRWNLSIYHTWNITDTVRIAPGTPELDQLDGQALTAGGVPRHKIELEGGLFKNGYGLRFNGTWNAPSHVEASGLPGSSDLRFGSTFVVKARIFVDLGQQENLVEKMPFLKGARLSLVVDNLFDSRQKVTDASGATPYAYQQAFREPQGRVIGIDFRKMF